MTTGVCLFWGGGRGLREEPWNISQIEGNFIVQLLQLVQGICFFLWDQNQPQDEMNRASWNLFFV